MADVTVVQPATPLAYSKFAGDLAWNLNELEYRTRATLTTLHGSNDIDADSRSGVALSYLLQGIMKRVEELALQVSNSEFVYVTKPGSQVRSAS